MDFFLRKSRISSVAARVSGNSQSATASPTEEVGANSLVYLILPKYKETPLWHIATRTRTNTNPNDTEANAAGRSVPACVPRKSKS